MGRTWPAATRVPIHLTTRNHTAPLADSAADFRIHFTLEFTQPQGYCPCCTSILSAYAYWFA